MKHWLIALTLLLFAPLCAPVQACLNDRDSDSLAAEGQGLPDIPWIITGRFERSPPLFYEMRIDRAKRALEAPRESWDTYLRLFDDIAVAYDRLGKSEDAIVWIEKKHACLNALEKQGTTKGVEWAKENCYRYEANVGTFWAHRWLRNGAKPETLGEMRTAASHIQKALDIKPDAHFGREKYQLLAMRWIISIYEKKQSAAQGARDLKKPITLGIYILKATEKDVDRERGITTGLAGLIMLGNAWESVDVFDALARALYEHGDAQLGYLASLRVRELLTAGKKSLLAPDYFTVKRMDSIIREQTSRVPPEEYTRTPGKHVAPPGRRSTTEEKFNLLRRDADSWQSARQAFMLERLKQGRHPDTDAGFFAGYQSPAPPTLALSWRDELQEKWSAWQFKNPGTIIFFVLSLLIGAVIGLFQLVRWIVRRLAR